MRAPCRRSPAGAGGRPPRPRHTQRCRLARRGMARPDRRRTPARRRERPQPTRSWRCVVESGSRSDARRPWNARQSMTTLRISARRRRSSGSIELGAHCVSRMSPAAKVELAASQGFRGRVTDPATAAGRPARWRPPRYVSRGRPRARRTALERSARPSGALESDTAGSRPSRESRLATPRRS